MFKPAWAQFVPHISSRGTLRRTTTLRRPVRLHAERLEDRMLMSANDPANAIGAVLAAPESRPAGIADVAVVSSAHIATDTKTASLTTEAPWERFSSNKDFRAWLIQAATAEWGNVFGKPTYSPYYYNWYTRVDSIALTGLQMSGFVTANDVSNSTTNLQVEGVDEADLVETDGNFLYIVSGQDLVIVSAGEGEDLKVMSRVHLDERPIGMYLSGNRLAIVSSSGGYNSMEGIRGIQLIDFVVAVGEFDSTGNYQPTTLSKPTTTVTVLDITDRAAPTLAQKTQLEGQLVSSRTVDGELRLVLSNELRLPRPIAKLVESKSGDGLEYAPVESGELHDEIDFLAIDRWWPGSYGENYVYETQDEYVARIYDEILGSLDARVRSLAADDSVISDTPLFEATDLYRPDGLSARNVTTVATFDLNSNQAGPVARASVLTGDGAQVYATADSIYVFAQRIPPFNADGFQSWDAATKTNVWKFAMDSKTHSIDLAAKGEFDGMLLNQFAADEHDGYLRVVSQPAGWTGTGQSVIVLQQVGKHLNVVGSISGIAADESLYSVRFVGDRAFFVTFRQFDPLFAVDLSDPTNPQLTGELHIPGYSEYLQPIDDTHLLAIGRDTSLWGGGAEEPNALQISIFDVSDLSNPRLTDRYSFGGGYTTVTPATGSSFFRSGDSDHHAVSYFADGAILALPIHTLQDSWWGTAENLPLFEPGHGGLQVFKIDVDAGFAPIGLIEHDAPIERSVRIGDRLFAISSGTISVHNMADPTVRLGEVNIGASAGMQPVELKMYQAVTEEPIEQLLKTQTYVAESALNDAPHTSPAAEVNVGATAATLSQAGWVLPSLAPSGHTQPARVAAFRGISVVRRFDNELVHLLAADTASEGSTSDSFIHEVHLGAADSDEIGDFSSRKNQRFSNLRQLPHNWFSSAKADDSYLADVYV